MSPGCWPSWGCGTGCRRWSSRTSRGWCGPAAETTGPPPGGRGSGVVPASADVVGEVAQQGRLGLGADDRLDHLAAGEDRHRRDREDLVLLRDLRILVDVQLRHGDLVPVLRGDLLQDRGDHLAG